MMHLNIELRVDVGENTHNRNGPGPNHRRASRNCHTGIHVVGLFELPGTRHPRSRVSDPDPGRQTNLKGRLDGRTDVVGVDVTVPQPRPVCTRATHDDHRISHGIPGLPKYLHSLGVNLIAVQQEHHFVLTSSKAASSRACVTGTLGSPRLGWAKVGSVDPHPAGIATPLASANTGSDWGLQATAPTPASRTPRITVDSSPVHDWDLTTKRHT